MVGFRGKKIDDVLCCETTDKDRFLIEVLRICQNYDVIDLQYSTRRGEVMTVWSALILVREKKKR
jgi:hypothetical protein